LVNTHPFPLLPIFLLYSPFDVYEFLSSLEDQRTGESTKVYELSGVERSREERNSYTSQKLYSRNIEVMGMDECLPSKTKSSLFKDLRMCEVNEEVIETCYHQLI
jgi:hypothetical protein